MSKPNRASLRYEISGADFPFSTLVHVPKIMYLSRSVGKDRKSAKVQKSMVFIDVSSSGFGSFYALKVLYSNSVE